jgi:hypothetical protein
LKKYKLSSSGQIPAELIRAIGDAFYSGNKEELSGQGGSQLTN